jgi:hypothetical protein
MVQQDGGPAARDARQSSWLRSRLDRFTATDAEVQAAEEQNHAARLGGSPIGEVVQRTSATVCGVLRSVTLRPRAGVPALEAELYDGTGAISLVWLGRRHIAGIEPGRRLRVTGMVTGDVEGRSIFNPRYELLPPRV